MASGSQVPLVEPHEAAQKVPSRQPVLASDVSHTEDAASGSMFAMKTTSLLHASVATRLPTATEANTGQGRGVTGFPGPGQTLPPRTRRYLSRWSGSTEAKDQRTNIVATASGERGDLRSVRRDRQKREELREIEHLDGRGASGAARCRNRRCTVRRPAQRRTRGELPGAKEGKKSTRRDALSFDNDDRPTIKEARQAEKDALSIDNDDRPTIKEARQAEKDALSFDNDDRPTIKEARQAEKDALQTMNDTFPTRRDALPTRRGALPIEREALRVAKRRSANTTRRFAGWKRRLANGKRHAVRTQRHSSNRIAAFTKPRDTLQTRRGSFAEMTVDATDQ